MADVSVGADIFMNGLKYDDLGIYYISALINRNLFAPNLETLSSQADYFMNGDVDDFNKNFLVKIN